MSDWGSKSAAKLGFMLTEHCSLVVCRFLFCDPAGRDLERLTLHMARMKWQS